MKKLLTLILCLAMVLTVFAGCSSTPATEEGASASGDAAQGEAADSEYKDTLVFAMNTDVQSLDPQIQNDTTSEQVVKMLYNTLLKFQDDGTVVGDLAESWSVSEDKLTWTFNLKQGVKFHNGKELTSADVKATFDRALNAEAGGLRTTEIIKMFTAVEAPDPYTVTITTDGPYGPMESLMCNMSLGIMDADYIEQYGLDLGTSAEGENGTGPFKVVSWERDQEIVVERFDDYFGTPAKLQTVVYTVIPEAASRVIALETGEVDVIDKPTDEDLARLEADTENFTVLRKPTISQRLFRFGCNDPIISNTKVRQAIVYAIDRQAIIDALFTGSAYPSTAPLAPVTFGYSDLGEIEQDLELAKSLLAEAGYPDGFDTKIVTTERYQNGIELAEIISQQLAEIGINAKIEVWEWSALSASWNGITADEFDQPIFIMGAGPSMRDADGGLRGLYTTSETGLNDRNYGFYSNAEVDALIEQGMQETDQQKRVEIYKEAMEILYREDPVAFWLFDMYGLAITSSKVEGVTLSPISTITFENATVKK
ncbi:MAG: ABC transporter substrate-binding protein [Oscillospiraceae bacterium]